MPPKSKNIKSVDKSTLNGSRIAIEKIPRKPRKSLKSEEGDKVGKVPSELEPVVNPKRKIFDSGLQGEALASRQKKIKHSEDVFEFETLSSDSRVKMVVEEHPNRLINSDQEANFAGRSERVYFDVTQQF